MNRIASLPRRDWQAGAIELAEGLTEILRTPSGTMTLRPIQAVALAEIAENQGLFGHIRVGAGKTLISALAAVVLNARRPILLVPAALIPKTLADIEALRVHWNIPNIQVVSYSKLGQHAHAEWLNAYEPDLIVADEAHKLKFVRKSAVARRVARYMHDHPATRFVGLSGTLTKGSILDYAHVLIWALRDRSPIPLTENAQIEWANLLDARAGNSGDYAPLAAAFVRCPDSLSEARKLYQERLANTPGVLISRDTFADTKLSIHVHRYEVPEILAKHFKNLRKEWCAPDGWYLADKKFEVWRVARQLAMGFYSKHDPRPPEPWFAARKAWCSFVRRVLENSTEYDSEKQVALACASGRLPTKVWRDWREIEPTFVLNTVTEWLTTEALDLVGEWERAHGPAVIWSESIPLAEALAERFGWDYYGEQGLNARGESIRTVKGHKTIVASLQACGTGQNLQVFHRCLFTAPPSNNVFAEQAIGRFHREDQKRDVEVHYLVSIEEHENSIRSALQEADYTFETTGQEQKLLIAEWHNDDESK